MKTMQWMLMAAMSLALLCMAGGMIHAQTAEKSEGVKIAYVDFQKILDESVEGKKAQAKLEEEFGDTKEMLEQKSKELRELRNQMEKQKDVLSSMAMEEKKNMMRAKYQSFMQQKQMLQQQYNSEFVQLIEPMQKEINGIITQIGKERGYTVIFKYDKSAKTDQSSLAESLFFPSAISYFDPGVDITDEVLKRYDAKHKK